MKIIQFDPFKIVEKKYVEMKLDKIYFDYIIVLWRE